MKLYFKKQCGFRDKSSVLVGKPVAGTHFTLLKNWPYLSLLLSLLFSSSLYFRVITCRCASLSPSLSLSPNWGSWCHPWISTGLANQCQLCLPQLLCQLWQQQPTGHFGSHWSLCRGGDWSRKDGGCLLQCSGTWMKDVPKLLCGLLLVAENKGLAAAVGGKV